MGEKRYNIRTFGIWNILIFMTDFAIKTLQFSFTHWCSYCKKTCTQVNISNITLVGLYIYIYMAQVKKVRKLGQNVPSYLQQHNRILKLCFRTFCMMRTWRGKTIFTIKYHIPKSIFNLFITGFDVCTKCVRYGHFQRDINRLPFSNV